MTPEAAAAHRIVQALTTIHTEFSVLSPRDREFLARSFDMHPSSFDVRIDTAAKLLEAHHPFQPVSETQRAQLVDELADCVSDLSRHEIAAEILNADNNTEAEWRMLADEKIDNLRFDMEHEDDPETKAEYAQQIADFEALADE